jgi:two-component system nitrogen regulation response regulator GlnG
LPLLVQHYLRRFSRELGKDVQSATDETLELLRHYPWTGNVRELQSVLKQALLVATGPILLAEFLPAVVRKESPDGLSGVGNGAGVATLLEGAEGLPGLGPFLEERLRAGSENLYEETLRRMERTVLVRVLQHTGGNQLQAAKVLGITRGSLRTKIRDLGIRIDRTVSGGEEPAE